MQNLLLFLIRYGALFVFLALEGICYLLIVNYNDNQRAIHLNSINLYASVLNERYENIINYFRLDAISDSLAQENAALLHRLITTASDSSKAMPRNSFLYEVQSAKVINNSITARRNTFTLNKGRTDGLDKNMAVITTSGIAGIVKKVSDHHALALSLLHPDFRISAKIDRNGYFGSLVWPGRSIRKMRLIDLPNHADVLIGDTIVTTEFSALFPEGIRIGEVDTFWVEDGSNSFEIDVRLSTDMANLQYVYVVKNQEMKDLQSLQDE